MNMNLAESGSGARPPSPLRRRLRALTACAALVVPLVACEDPADRSVLLGDRLLAVGEMDAAIAEYKLAQRQHGDAEEIMLRLGHAYAVRGDVDEALAHYEALAENERYRHQIAADLVALATDARERGASENMARSVQPLLEWGLGYVPADLLLSLARHHARDGDHTRALSLYLAVLGEEDEPGPALFYETGRAYSSLGGCDRALPYFEQYVGMASRRAAEYDAARFHYGNCLFVSADEDRASGRPASAIQKLEAMVALGVPRTLLADAHFLRGEMYLSIGNNESALEAYQRVLDLNPSRTGAMVREAEQRIRQIRFGFESG
ncbi:MAG: tetratricopeptide repeat protein [Gemmatimonadota bacterium]|nr:tetratricopeptide repeat protein [Gemmatimonadota bacterium]